MPSIKTIQKPIVAEMKHFDVFFHSLMRSKAPLLNIITKYIIRRKGKRMRPMLVFLSAKLLGEINETTYNAAAFIELMHTATLIHDDVVDNSFERRSFFSVNALWKNKVAVLIGDYLLAKGLLLAVREKEYDLLDVVSEAVQEMSEGELLQIEKARSLDITEEVYFKIINKKTATLIAACTSIGAKSVGADAQTIAKMKTCGHKIGIAFQIKDDIFDYQDKGIIGKPTGNDLQEQKITLPLIYALKNASPKVKRNIIRLVKRHNNKPKKIKEVIDFVVNNNGLDYAVEKMNTYKNEALDILNEFPDSDAKKALIELIHYTTTRNK